MTVSAEPMTRWKTPEDLRRRLTDRFEQLVAADLRAPGAPIDAFAITTPGLVADVIARRFADVRAWADEWLRFAAAESELDLTLSDRQDRRFGAVHIPKTAQVRSIDAAARLLRRTKELAVARCRHAALTQKDARLDMAGCWPAIVAMSDDDFDLLRQLAGEVATLDLSRLRLREVSVAGMHTKFLEDHRAVLKPLLAAMNVRARADARTWPGRLGFLEDDTAMIELRDLSGDLLPYPHLAAPSGRLTEASPTSAVHGHLRRVVIVENKATFMALPPAPGAVAIFGQGGAVRALSAAKWLRDQPLLYLGDLDHAGYHMVAGLRRDGLAHLETALMDVATAEAYRRYWVADTSTAGTVQAYEGLTEAERAAWRLMAEGPWRLEQERIPFDVLRATLARWLCFNVQDIAGDRVRARPP
jgi:hypothetical protein